MPHRVAVTVATGALAAFGADDRSLLRWVTPGAKVLGLEAFSDTAPDLALDKGECHARLRGDHRGSYGGARGTVEGVAT